MKLLFNLIFGPVYITISLLPNLDKLMAWLAEADYAKGANFSNGQGSTKCMANIRN